MKLVFLVCAVVVLDTSNGSLGVCHTQSTADEMQAHTLQRMSCSSAPYTRKHRHPTPVELRSCVKVGVRTGLPVPNSPYGLCGLKAILNLNHCGSELRSCVKVEVSVLCSLSLIVLMVSVAIKQHWT